MQVVGVEVYGASAWASNGSDVIGGEQAGPGVEGARQLHVADVVTWEVDVYSSSGFPSALNGLCSGHFTFCLGGVVFRGCRSGSDGTS